MINSEVCRVKSNPIEQVNNTYSQNRHYTMMKQCKYYIWMLDNQVVSAELIQEANQFSNDIYAELKNDDPIIVTCNTSFVQRNIDALSNLKLNLSAIHKMVEELLAKESITMVEAVSDENWLI